MKSKIVFYYCIVSLSSYAAEIPESCSNSSGDTASTHSSSLSIVSARPTMIPALNFASIQRVRSQSASSSSSVSQTAIISPRVSAIESPKQQWAKNSPRKEAPLLIEVAQRAYNKALLQEAEQERGIEPKSEISQERNNTAFSLRLEIDDAATALSKLEDVMQDIENNIESVSQVIQEATDVLLDKRADKKDKESATESTKGLDAQLKNLGKMKRKIQKEITSLEDKKEELEEELRELQKK